MARIVPVGRPFMTGRRGLPVEPGTSRVVVSDQYLMVEEGITMAKRASMNDVTPYFSRFKRLPDSQETLE